ncbi:hypothetical protein H8S95_08710 [Pontibacter sp. KCTC 32443]|uniref:hypothetical protein n=1 Tax=Pontibacter sp. KCTC 32443 TaxID=2764721 RepID=UPI00164E96FD|nr:hypothetical protein [Pontibacter sp. KCTC 32443]MBC5774140.1 hypothetical protein [Pontibacter sp. KCTC 32443]
MLAGAALFIHYKQDQTLLASAAQQKGDATIAAGTSANSEATGNNATLAQPQNSQSYTSASIPDQATIAQVTTAENSATIPGSSARIDQSSKYNHTASEAATSPVTTTAPGSEGMIAIATERTGETTTAEENRIGALTEQKVNGFVPATQAIANVPDNYTSSNTMHPLLRRNATIGSTTPEAQESIALQKQAEQALTLSSPAGSDAEKKSIADSRWNVGMNYGSSYFAQNINIPGYTITPFRVMFNPDPNMPPPPPEPSMSDESKENMRDARIEFQKNTQAAMSYNVDAKAGFRLGKRLKLLAGLGYSQNTSKTKTSYIVEQYIFKPRTNERIKLQPTTVFLPSLNTFTTDSISVVKTKAPFDVDYSYQMLSVPVGLQVEGNMSEKWFWFAHGGGAVNLLMQTTIKAANPEIASVTYGPTDDSPFRKVQFSGNLGVGLGKRLSNAVSVSFGPEYRHFITSMLAKEHAIANQDKPYTIGVNMGINYMLGQGSK